MKPQVTDKQEKQKQKESWKNIAAFWVFGFCKNFTQVIILTASQDILSKSKDPDGLNRLASNTTAITDLDVDPCILDISTRRCFEKSAGIMLLCNFLPSFIARMITPFCLGVVPYSLANWVVCILQAISILMVALFDVMWINLTGVCIGSFSSGLAESFMLSMTGLYHKDTVGGWSSGTGLAGVVSSMFYSTLTDRKLVGMSISAAIMLTIFVPILSIMTYHFVLIKHTSEEKKIRRNESNNNSGTSEDNCEPVSKIETLRRLFKFIVIFIVVYFSQYFVNQGLLEITIYDCAHSFGKGPYAQYRWYQVLYQWGVFLARSSHKLVSFGVISMLTFPWIQVLIAIGFVLNTMYFFIPHFGIAAFFVFTEGLIGGIAYVNVFSYVHKTTPSHMREFGLSVVSPSRTFGVVLAALAAIPAHNLICQTTPKILWLL